MCGVWFVLFFLKSGGFVVCVFSQESWWYVICGLCIFPRRLGVWSKLRVCFFVKSGWCVVCVVCSGVLVCGSWFVFFLAVCMVCGLRFVLLFKDFWWYVVGDVWFVVLLSQTAQH